MRQPGSESEKTEDGWRETKKKKKKKNYWWCFTAVAISNSALISIQCNESNYLLQLKNKSIIGIVMDNSSNIEMGPVHIVVSSPISWWYYCYNAVSPKETCIVNAYCQFSKQACTNFMQVFVNINPILYTNGQFELGNSRSWYFWFPGKKPLKITSHSVHTNALYLTYLLCSHKGYCYLFL